MVIVRYRYRGRIRNYRAQDMQEARAIFRSVKREGLTPQIIDGKKTIRIPIRRSRARGILLGDEDFNFGRF